MKKIYFLSLLALLAFSGCQQIGTSFEPSQPTQELPTPYSKGPTSSPTQMKGPSGPPPDLSSTFEAPQSAVEKEKVSLTLPLSSSKN